MADREPFWAHVAAFGALWGCIEMTFGAFLHTLHIPFAGVVLASIGACILVGGRQILPRRGTALATAVVAALLKSLSPGGVILGPMLGILMEGTLVELAMLISSRSMATALLAGVLVACWAAVQKVLVQVLLYGAPIIDLYVALLHKATDWLGLAASTGWDAVAMLLSVLVLMGAVGGITGLHLGRQVRFEMGAGVPR